jgi:hypothetical protein
MPELKHDGSVYNHGRSIVENTTGMSAYLMLGKNPIEILGRPVAAASEGKRIYVTMDTEGEGYSKKWVGPSNRAFSKIDNELASYVKGRILAYGFVPEKGSHLRGKFVNLNMADFRYIVDFFRTLYDSGMRAKVTEGPVLKVLGVRVNCIGDRAVFIPPRTEDLELVMPGANEGEWDNSAAHKIGIPIVVSKCEPGLSWRGRKFEGADSLYNEKHVQLTTRNYFDRNLFHGRTTDERDKFVTWQGTLLVVRQDKKPLHAVHVQAMATYFEKKAEEHQKMCIKNRTLGDMNEYLASLSKEEFLKHYAKTVEECKTRPYIYGYGDAENLADVPSPYDV